jgi:hypothetical protein
MNKSFTTLTFAAALAASLAAALPAEARGPHGIPLPPLPSGIHIRGHLPPLPPPPFFVGSSRYRTMWLPDRYYGDWIYVDGDWRCRPHRNAYWSRGRYDRHRAWVPGGWGHRR